MKILVFIAALASLFILTNCSRAGKRGSYTIAKPLQTLDPSHAAFTEVLKRHVKNERVDYAALKKDPDPLVAYLDTLASVPESAFKKWSREEQMAFLINLYNAATLKLVVDHYPVKSIEDIGGVFKGPWKQPVVRVFGKFETLDHIEHDLLRPEYKDPRVHFALNCAAIGCPSLRAEAFQAAKLEDQLDEQGRLFLRDTSRNRLDAGKKTLHLSPIFEWFKVDFTTKSGTVEKFILPYLSDADRTVVEQGGLSIKHTDYDWSLNQP
jgi:hypothetical protein